MTGIEVAVGALVGWFLRKAGRAAKRVDGIADDAVDAVLDRAHDLVLAKLGADPAVAKMEREAAETGEVSTRTRERVRMSIEDAAEEDKDFAAEIESLAALPQTSVINIVKGSVKAKDGGIAIGNMSGGTNNLPQGPARP
jgi:hypothetical protein